MEFTQFPAPNAPRRSGSAIAELLAEGVSRADVDTALAFQRVQRGAGVMVQSLRTIIYGKSDTRPVSSGGLATSPVAQLLKAPAAPRARRGGMHRTGRPVWGASVRTDSAAEAEFVHPLRDDVRKRIKDAAYRTWRRAKDLARDRRAGLRELTEHERKLIGFTTSCRDILIRLLDHEQLHRGWCMPSYEKIEAWTGLSRATVARSLAILADIGLAEWIRRFIYTHDPEVGARSEQTSNLYRFGVPDWLGKLIGLPPIPVPDDEAQRRAEADEEMALMLASASAADRARLMPEDNKDRARFILAAHNARVGPGTPRESQYSTAPHNKIFINREEKMNRPSRPTHLP